MARRTWTNREEAAIREGIARGLTSGQIARKFPLRTLDAVKAKVRALKVADPALCECQECLDGDALPVRLHGIPHARQLKLIDAPPGRFIPSSSAPLPPIIGTYDDPDQTAFEGIGL